MKLCNYYIIFLFLILGCASNDKPLPPFQWDISAENHTGTSRNQYVVDGRHRGMSVFNWRNSNDEYVDQLVKNNIENIALVPFIFQETDTTKVIRRRRKIKGEWSYYDSMYIKVIEEIHSRNMHVFYKPHLWMNEGWRSTVSMENGTEWDAWFDSYSDHMLHFAMFAEVMNVDLFCIGTELRSSINAQPHRWARLIKEIKQIYSGKLTYAANWDGEYDDVQFWDEMDYIGIQAYYPLTSNDNPTLPEIKNGWNRHIKALEKLAKKHGKPILFTESGYRSDISATVKPWEWGNYQDTTGTIVSNQVQRIAYEAFFNKLWDKEWFAGVYFWQWHNRHGDEYKKNNTDFTPRYKPAENVMARWYGK